MLNMTITTLIIKIPIKNSFKKRFNYFSIKSTEKRKRRQSSHSYKYSNSNKIFLNKWLFFQSHTDTNKGYIIKIYLLIYFSSSAQRYS